MSARHQWSARLVLAAAGSLGLATMSSVALAEDDRFSDIGQGTWILEFRLPDSYLPRGFVRDPNNRHWVVKTVDPDGAHHAYCHQYALQPHGWVSNKRLSAEPNNRDCPMGFGGDKPFVPRAVGGVHGFWRQGYQSETRFQFNFMFKIGSCVAGFYMDASEAAAVKGNARVPRPTEQEILDVVGQFVDGYRRFITDKGWGDLEGKPATVVTGRSGAEDAGATERRPERELTAGTPGTSDFESDQAVVATSLSAAVAGALTALGAGLMMMGMGVTPRDVIDGARELLGGGGSPGAATTMEPLSEEQRGAAARIFSEGWENVSAEEQRLLASSPGWLRKAIRARLPAETIAGYEPGWKEKTAAVVTPALMVAQSGCDLAIGVTSTTMPGFGMAYTMFKNIAGGVSEGVHDWWWESNDRGLARNVAEGFTRGGLKGGVEIAVDATVGRLMGPAGGRRALDPNNIGWREFPWADALSEVAPEYFAGQAGKYGVGRAGDALVEVTDPVGSGHRPLRAEGFFDTTSPVEKATIDLLLTPERWPAASGPPAPRLPYMAQNLVQ